MTTKAVFLFTSIAFLMIHIPTQKSMAQGLFSPKNRINRYTSVGLGVGSSHYYGDLSSPSPQLFYYGLYTNVRFNVNANYTKHFNPNTAVRLQLAWVRLYGDDFNYAQRNMSKLYTNYIRNFNFVNDVKEMTISGIFNLIPTYDKGSKGRLNFTPYVTIGAGLIAHSPKTWYRDGNGVKKVALKNAATNGNVLPGAGTKSYSLVTAVLPMGFGVRWKVNNKIDVSLEGNIRISGTKYLDDVYRDPYPDETLLASYVGSENASLSKRYDELVHAKTGKDRQATLQEIYLNYVSPITGGTATTAAGQIAETLSFYDTRHADRGGYRFNDIYATTQITVSYIISDIIKCPVNQ
ncbi:hypothetical protein LAG90_05500 [Marinilongibacter aquaticus]|uniref:hypothetical protein n=1 Tax=Marinilongibacter aquaticus TaxID=2975157 RepID=UPI0021BD57CA|nr:hypothetical protein [Marinilongibacter aquaticus]UBM60095.1 hypothetical protein LAG90_05500 [Marinilongibacter aquaticus]